MAWGVRWSESMLRTAAAAGAGQITATRTGATRQSLCRALFPQVGAVGERTARRGACEDAEVRVVTAAQMILVGFKQRTCAGTTNPCASV